MDDLTQPTPTPPAPPPHPGKDTQLVTLVDWVDTGRWVLPVTLFVQGVVLAGVLVSGRAFSGVTAEVVTIVMGDALSPEDAEALRAEYAEKGNQRFPDLTEIEEDEPEGSRPEPDYLHLRVRTVVSGGQIFTYAPGEGPLWRGKIADVNGFLYGALEETAPPA